MAPSLYAGLEMIDNAAKRQFSLAATARTWFRDSVAYRGWLPTVCVLGTRIFEFARDLTPSRRRLRFGDLQYDFDNRVDTTWSNVRLRTRLRELFSGEQYQPIEPEQFRGMIDALGIDCSAFTFIDLGSGKGRALLLASEYPFRRIIGVEILPELHQIAQENIAKFSSAREKSGLIDLWRGDARDFAFPPEPTLLYLFNPFFEPVLEKVLLNLEASVQQHPREVLLLYVNPVSEQILRNNLFLTRMGGTRQYSLYASRNQ